jgi:ribosomal protein L37AE/L43A
MQIDLSKKSTNKQPGKAKVVDFDFEPNIKKPVVCSKCSSPEFEGFSTSFGLYRRCLKCNNEWPMGGISVLANLTKEEKEAFREINNNRAQDEAANKAASLAEDIEHLEDIKMDESLSGSSANRSFWNNYLSQWSYEE